MWTDFAMYHENFVSPPSLVLSVWHLSTAQEWALLFITPCYISLHCTQWLSIESFRLIFWHQFLNGCALLLVLCKPTRVLSIIWWPLDFSAVNVPHGHMCHMGNIFVRNVLTNRKCTMRLSTVLFWLSLHSLFWLGRYLPRLCQQVGGLESVSLYFDRNLKR